MSLSKIESLEKVFPLSIGEVTFIKLEDPTLLYFTIEGDNREHYIDWLDQDQECSSFEGSNEEDFNAVLDSVNAAIQVSNLKNNILRPWYFATQGVE